MMDRVAIPTGLCVIILVVAAGAMPSLDPAPHVPAEIRASEPTPGSALLEALDAVARAEQARFGIVLSPETASAPSALTLPGALDALLLFHDRPLTAADDAALSGLAALSPAQKTAVAHALHAFLAWETSVDAAFASPVPNDLAAVVTTRAAFLATIPALAAAFGEGERAGTPIGIAPVFALDPSGSNQAYWTEYHLIIDVGGNDVYRNNAGGNNVYGHQCDPWEVPVPDLLDPPIPAPPVVTAAVVDLAGHDVYRGDHGCAVNGGASRGAALLVDVAGHDQYFGECCGSNGGGYGYGLGLLIDVEGNDAYDARGAGTNGGGYGGGIGLLVDRAGDDTYVGAAQGTNGGAAGGPQCAVGCHAPPVGLGLLLDLGGTDSYDDDSGGSGLDKTVVPKGVGGAQVDV